MGMRLWNFIYGEGSGEGSQRIRYKLLGRYSNWPGTGERAVQAPIFKGSWETPSLERSRAAAMWKLMLGALL